MTPRAFKRLIASGLLGLAFLPGCEKEPNSPTFECAAQADELRLNEVQLLGSHNSYRQATYQPMYDWVLNLGWLLPPSYNPLEWDYDHLPLTTQFDEYGIRAIELDVYHDPNGGRYYLRKGHQFINETDTSYIPALEQPGFKVLHIPDFDYNTHHHTFVDALQTVKSWSDANPNHFPMVIMVEAKSETVADFVDWLDLVPALPFNAAAADSLEDEITAVFGAGWDGIFTPDDLRGSYTTVEEAVLNGGWPLLSEVRGKVIFVLSGGTNAYLSGHPGLQGRAMFTYAEPGDDHCAFVKRDDAIASESEIRALAEAGYLLRTRADAGTWEARNADRRMSNAAFRSGAHIISTDYYRPDPRHGSDPEWSAYSTHWSINQQARVNTVTGPEGARGCVLKE